MKYLTSLRAIIFILNGLVATAVFIIIYFLPLAPQLQIIRLTQTFGFLSLIYLYFSLIISPLFVVFPKFPLKQKIKDSRRAIGVCAFFFALLHSGIAFFGQLGGFRGIFFLSNVYLLDLLISFTALIILAILALTSFDRLVDLFTFPKWKLLHRLVYLAGLLILIHIFVLGTHFQSLTGVISQITFLLLAILVILDAIRIDRYLSKRWKHIPKLGPVLFIVLLLVITYPILLFSSTTSFTPGIHSQHLLLAQQVLKNTLSIPESLKGYSGLTGDPTLRYTTSFLHDETITPGIATTLHFRVNNAGTGEEVKLFSRVYTKTMHLIIVDKSLSYFNHIHPEQTDNDFSITTTFPKNGTYHLYTDFQPFGAIEQQMAFTVNVGESTTPTEKQNAPDKILTKQIGNYLVTMNFQSPLKAAALSLGQQKISFTLQDTETKKPITSLKPYLASFGHLSMINERTFDFVHVHPALLTPPAPNALGGPTVEFLPLGLYGPIKPGIYRIFAEFNPDGQLLTADFTVRIQ